MRIERAVPADAPYIASAVMMAVGDDIIEEFAGSKERLPLVRRVFERLAASDDAQYSYKNTIVARTQDGDVAGAIVSYDGACLYELRESFLKVAQEELGIDMRERLLPDETTPDEIYFDTIAVFPDYRKQGLATSLIEAAAEFHSTAGKPLGLLVEKENHRAFSLYSKVGFVKVGERPFAGTLMNHLQREKNKE